MSLKHEIFDFVKDDLQAIEKALQDNLNPYLDLVSDVASHILFAGGKRLRPVLMVLGARMCGCRGNGEIRLSTVFEYLHTATLLHDDVVDGASTRRGKPVAHAIWDPAAVVLVGDFLLSRTCSIATDTGRLAIIKVITDLTGVMAEGEILQMLNKKKLGLTEAEYMDVIFRKTAVLIAAACKVGGLLARAPEPEVDALSEYGRHLGIAFQMADDLLDYMADPEVTGKAVGADLAEGKLTLPLIHALEKAKPASRKTLEQAILSASGSREDFDAVVRAIVESGGVNHTQAQARKHAALAKDCLAIFPDSPEKHILVKIADFAVQRES